MYLLTSMFLIRDVQLGSGSSRFHAMLIWNRSERSTCSPSCCSLFLRLKASWGTLFSIGPSPWPPTYKPGWPRLPVASLHAFKSRLSSSCAGFLMPRTKNHRLCSKFGTHLRPWNLKWKDWTAALRKHEFRVSRKSSLSSVRICSVRERETWRGNGAPNELRHRKLVLALFVL
jgi:hypothetical protein